MKNNLGNNIDQDGIDNNSMNEMSDKEIAKKFDDQINDLRDIAEAEARDKETEDSDYDLQGKLDEVDDFFKKGKEGFGKIDTIKEIRIKIKYNRISKRSIDVQVAIKKAGESVLNEIVDWKKEKNPVAKSLLRMADWILKLELN